MVRLPCPCLIQFPSEKTLQEAATAAVIAKETGLPIPRQHFYDDASPVGPYVMMDYVETQGSVSARLTVPGKDSSVPHVLDPDIAESTLEAIWGQIAQCYLQLHQLKFPRIGSLVEISPGIYDVAGIPITHNMNDMVRLAIVPRPVLPPEGTTYTTADGWYTALAEMHIAQLVFQHNDAVVSEDDCRNKYVSRQIFRRLAIQGRLSTFGFSDDCWSAQSSKIPAATLSPAPSGSNNFRLWGDDFRAGNILLTSADKIAALVDWEFTYAGPTQFSLDPPWWLLLETVGMWSSGMDDWCEVYQKRLGTWLAAMRRAEAETDEPSSLPASLSMYMEQSWATGRFFLSYAARESLAFDAVYWKYLDERFFGDRGSGGSGRDLWRTRLRLLTDEERAAMEPFVARKMAEAGERRLVDWDPVDAKDSISQLLFD
ncbi:phosphotransferase [Candidatus Bathyarchaeota archaeon]|nr:phosphotransferase [Candidatus Bathyarchaeota archaeon]